MLQCPTAQGAAHPPQEAPHTFPAGLAETEANFILVLTSLKAKQTPVRYTFSLFPAKRQTKMILNIWQNLLAKLPIYK